MITRADYIRDCEIVRGHIVEQLKPLLSGKLHTGEHHYGLTPVDTTHRTITRLRNSLADRDIILAELRAQSW
jgi:hypothetical protein